MTRSSVNGRITTKTYTICLKRKSVPKFVTVYAIGIATAKSMIAQVTNSGVGLRRRRPTPLFVTCTVMLFAVAIPMAYTVTNFGTLFRLRQMVYVFVVILPLTLVSAAEAKARRTSA